MPPSYEIGAKNKFSFSVIAILGGGDFEEPRLVGGGQIGHRGLVTCLYFIENK
jgi:hypothetical protein